MLCWFKYLMRKFFINYLRYFIILLYIPVVIVILQETKDLYPGVLHSHQVQINFANTYRNLGNRPITIPPASQPQSTRVTTKNEDTRKKRKSLPKPKHAAFSPLQARLSRRGYNSSSSFSFHNCKMNDRARGRESGRHTQRVLYTREESSKKRENAPRIWKKKKTKRRKRSRRSGERPRRGKIHPYSQERERERERGIGAAGEEGGRGERERGKIRARIDEGFRRLNKHVITGARASASAYSWLHYISPTKVTISRVSSFFRCCCCCCRSCCCCSCLFLFLGRLLLSLLVLRRGGRWWQAITRRRASSGCSRRRGWSRSSAEKER